jgi:hypothetical protein
MVGIQKESVVLVPFSQVIGKKKVVSPDLLNLATLLSI